MANDRASITPIPAPGLRRVLGLTEVTAGGIGIIIGAGIYVLLGAATAQAGASVWMSFVLAAVLSLLTGLSYAELSSMFPSAAGEYEYTRQAMPEWVAFVVGWMMIVGLVVAAATVSLGFGVTWATSWRCPRASRVSRSSRSCRSWPSRGSSSPRGSRS